METSIKLIFKTSSIDDVDEEWMKTHTNFYLTYCSTSMSMKKMDSIELSMLEDDQEWIHVKDILEGNLDLASIFKLSLSQIINIREAIDYLDIMDEYFESCSNIIDLYMEGIKWYKQHPYIFILPFGKTIHFEGNNKDISYNELLETWSNIIVNDIIVASQILGESLFYLNKSNTTILLSKICSISDIFIDTDSMTDINFNGIIYYGEIFIDRVTKFLGPAWSLFQDNEKWPHDMFWTGCSLVTCLLDIDLNKCNPSENLHLYVPTNRKKHFLEVIKFISNHCNTKITYGYSIGRVLCVPDNTDVEHPSRNIEIFFISEKIKYDTYLNYVDQSHLLVYANKNNRSNYLDIHVTIEAIYSWLNETSYVYYPSIYRLERIFRYDFDIHNIESVYYKIENDKIENNKEILSDKLKIKDHLNNIIINNDIAMIHLQLYVNLSGELSDCRKEYLVKSLMNVDYATSNYGTLSKNFKYIILNIENKYNLIKIKERLDSIPHPVLSCHLYNVLTFNEFSNNYTEGFMMSSIKFILRSVNFINELKSNIINESYTTTDIYTKFEKFDEEKVKTHHRLIFSLDQLNNNKDVNILNTIYEVISNRLTKGYKINPTNIRSIIEWRDPKYILYIKSDTDTNILGELQKSNKYDIDCSIKAIISRKNKSIYNIIINAHRIYPTTDI